MIRWKRQVFVCCLLKRPALMILHVPGFSIKNEYTNEACIRHYYDAGDDKIVFRKRFKSVVVESSS